MKLVNSPIHYSLKDYDESIQRILNVLLKLPSVLAVYQVGGLSAPGISDVDLWVIFKDDETCLINPLAGINSTDKYFFIHNLFGICKKHFVQSQNFDFFHDFTLLYGCELRNDLLVDKGEAHLSVPATRQAALEYMLKMFLVMTIEKEFHVVKVRNFLLTAKALILDLPPLNLEGHQFGLINLLEQIVHMRNQWFSEPVSNEQFRVIYNKLYDNLEQGLRHYFRYSFFEVPMEADLDLGSNVVINGGNQLNYQVNGFSLPSFVLVQSPRLYNLQRRLMQFNFYVPIKTDDIEPVIKSRFEFIAEANRYNHNYLPYFISVPYGLSIFKEKR